ncbi:MAG: hypothetical protein PVG39_00150 [Desulfobacteraceae bacterium]
METRIQTDETERIEVLLLDGSLSPLTSLSNAFLSIRRVSDGYWYDFNDDTFKNSGWTTRQQVMTETDSTNDQGVYHYDFDTSAITNVSANDTYELRVDCASATNVPQIGEIKVGQFIDYINGSISSRALEANVEGHVTTALNTYDPPTRSEATSDKEEVLAAINIAQSDITFLKDIEGGRWKIEGVQMIFYKSDNSTEVARFNLFDAAGNPTSAVEVFERRRI